MAYATGILTYNRPLHTALTLAYAFMNKSASNDLHVFYGTYLSATPPSRSLYSMLVKLRDAGYIELHFMQDDKPQNTQGNVDNLMLTLTAMDKYEYFIKIDDDVLIGKGSDDLMIHLLRKTEKDGVYMLMGQVVTEHLNRRNPFVWQTEIDGYKVAQRSRRACPMETYTAVSKKLLPMLRAAGISVSCSNARGTYGIYTKNVSSQGYKVGLVLDPAVKMQHIGMTTTIDSSGAARCWAPAKSWNPPGKVIEVPPFDFGKWEGAHGKDTHPEVTVELLEDLRKIYPREYLTALNMIIEEVKAYDPKSTEDTPLPPDPKKAPGVTKERPVVRRRSIRERQLRGGAQATPTTPTTQQATKTRVGTTAPLPEPQHMEVQRARRRQVERAQQQSVIQKLPTGQLVRRVRTPQNVVVRTKK